MKKISLLLLSLVLISVFGACQNISVEKTPEQQKAFQSLEGDSKMEDEILIEDSDVPETLKPEEFKQNENKL
ncbi:MAG: hypothetical protein ACRC7S_12985 [Cetobacterium sp.]